MALCAYEIFLQLNLGLKDAKEQNPQFKSI